MSTSGATGAPKGARRSGGTDGGPGVRKAILDRTAWRAEQFGPRLVAFVVLNGGATATPDGPKQHVRENLANYKVPREITILADLPRSSTGMIVGRELPDRVARA